MWIVKLGGSLAFDPHLVSWLQMLATYGGGRVTVVAGGAAFADTVRTAQAHWRFGDLAAHNMAILAMAQTSLMMHALEPRIALASNDTQIRRTLHSGRTALWLPLAMMRDAPDTLTSWDVTSDSLSLWLARRLHAERLILVKSCAVDGTKSLAEHGEEGVVDARFAQWAEDAAFPIDLVQRDDTHRVREALVAGAEGSRLGRAGARGVRQLGG